jgi:hypothetical protein
MKTLIALLVLLATVGSYAQTYMNFFVTTTNLTSIVVPTNTLMTIVNIYSFPAYKYSGGLTGPAPYETPNLGAVITFPDTDITGISGTLSYPYNWFYAGEGTFYGGPEYLVASRNSTVLGPATVNFNYYNSSPYTDYNLALLLKFEAVNATPAISGFAVQPPSQTASISLQTSTNLTTWTTITNAVYPATNSARFFRMDMTLTK